MVECIVFARVPRCHTDRGVFLLPLGAAHRSTGGVRHYERLAMSLKKTAVLSIYVLSLTLLPAARAFACHVNDPAFEPRYRCNVQSGCNINEELNDYARILADADSNDRNCAEAADYALTNKLNDTPNTVWNQWLEGALVSYIYMAANRIGANGFATQDLDNALASVHSGFTQIGRELDGNGNIACTKESGDQCVDDFLVGAPGFAWEAAYYHRRGDPYGDVATLQQKAKDGLDAGFNEVCIAKDPHLSGETYCNGSAFYLENPSYTAGTQSFNHGQRMPSYGYGLMTSAVNAALGLQASDYTQTIFSSDEQKIARGLAKEMQLFTSNNEFTNQCEPWGPPDPNGNVPLLYCGGPDNYSAHMYELKEAYDTYFGGMPAGGFQGDLSSFSSSSFPGLGPSGSGFFSYGRYMYYYTQSYEWVQGTPYARQYLPFDAANPIGYVDFVDANGVMHGWTCDTDASYGSNRVDVYSNGTFAGYAYATEPSEGAVNSLCGGGSAHRFLVQLPAWARNTTLTSYGLDYTWYGFTALPCSSGDCGYH